MYVYRILLTAWSQNTRFLFCDHFAVVTQYQRISYFLHDKKNTYIDRFFLSTSANMLRLMKKLCKGLEICEAKLVNFYKEMCTTRSKHFFVKFASLFLESYISMRL